MNDLVNFMPKCAFKKLGRDLKHRFQQNKLKQSFEICLKEYVVSQQHFVPIAQEENINKSGHLKTMTELQQRVFL